MRCRVAWALFPDAQVAFTRGVQATYASSPGVRRGFCVACGSQSSVAADCLPGMIDVTVASLDEPAALCPTVHCWDGDRLPWLRLDDGLSRQAGFPPMA